MKLIKKILYRIRGDYTTEELISNGMKVGKNFNRLHGTILDPGHCWLIHIGDDVTLAPRVHILCHDASTKTFLGYTKIGRVSIGNRVFIGAESVVLPGVSIGDNVVIGANSTVTHDIPSNSVAVGSPAKVICSLDEYVKKEQDRFEISPVYDESYIVRTITEEKKQEQIKELKDKIGYIV